MVALSAIGTFFAMIANAVAEWLARLGLAGVPVVACVVFLACFGLFERLVLRRLIHFNSATSVQKETKEGK